MLNGFSFEDNTDARPTVVDGEVVWLPTLAGLLRGESGSSPAPKGDLWSALTAASTSEVAFDRMEKELAEGRDLADVIDMESRRSSESG